MLGDVSNKDPFVDNDSLREDVCLTYAGAP